MVNNYININKTNNNLKQLNINKNTTYEVGNPVLAWDRCKGVAG